MMNCKQGDLAIVVRSHYGNEGKIVRCLYAIRSPFLCRDGSVTPALDAWSIDHALPSHNGQLTPFAPDEYLRPIRDSDGEDEMLRIAGKPEERLSELERIN